MDELIVVRKPPKLPAKWDYSKSVAQVKQVIYKWKNVKGVMAEELWIAREKLRQKGGRPSKTLNESSELNWTSYCEEIGSSVQVVNRWLAQAYPTKTAHVSHNSGENEWYTPQPYIDAAKAVMGSIDLDPASSAKANEVVKAKSIFTAKDSGLKHPCKDTVWMNPPYAAELIGKFISKLVAEVEAERTTEAIVLVNNATETKWFAELASVSSALCFPSGRVKFWQASGKIAQPLQGQCVAYIGSNVTRFALNFAPFGIICDIVH